MAQYLLTAVLLICCTAACALSSTTNSAPFTPDTVNPHITIIAPNSGEAWHIGDSNPITWTTEDASAAGFRRARVRYINPIHLKRIK
ncbi:MAG: hypothetical protein WCR92_02905 [Candidatus Cloacimonadaceae bacterium]